MKKRALTTILAFLSGLALMACSPQYMVHIAGERHMTLEVHNEFHDPGLVCPNRYKIKAISDLDIDRLGEYKITYEIYRDSTKVLELDRFVEVVDTSAPYASPLNGLSLNVGVPYLTRRLLEDYSDNYDDMYSLVLNPTMIVFKESGIQSFVIEVTDTSGNACDVEGYADLTYDPSVILQENKTVYAIEEMGQFQYYQGQSSVGEVAFRWYNDGHITFSKIIELDPVYSTVLYLDADYNNIANSTLRLYMFQNEEKYFIGTVKYNPTLNPLAKVRKYDTIESTISGIDDVGTFNYFDRYLEEYISGVKDVITNIFFLKWGTFLD